VASVDESVCGNVLSQVHVLVYLFLKCFSDAGTILKQLGFPQPLVTKSLFMARYMWKVTETVCHLHQLMFTGTRVVQITARFRHPSSSWVKDALLGKRCPEQFLGKICPLG